LLLGSFELEFLPFFFIHSAYTLGSKFLFFPFFLFFFCFVFPASAPDKTCSKLGGGGGTPTGPKTTAKKIQSWRPAKIQPMSPWKFYYFSPNYLATFFSRDKNRLGKVFFSNGFHELKFGRTA